MVGSLLFLIYATQRLSQFRRSPPWPQPDQHPRCPQRVAASTGRCNTSVESLCRRFKLQGFAWPFVELTRHFVQMSLRVYRHVGAFSKVSAWASRWRACVSDFRASMGSLPSRIRARADAAYNRASVMLTSGYTPSPMSRRWRVTGDTNRNIHLPRPFSFPGWSRSPVTEPSATGRSPGLIFRALKSERIVMPAPHPAPHYVCACMRRHESV